MPQCYSFKDRETNQLVDLNKIDELICCDLGIAVDETHYSMPYQIITIVGPTMCHDTGIVTEKSFQHVIAELQSLDEGIIIVMRKYLLDKYEFSAWYQRY